MLSSLILHKSVTSRTLLAARPGPIVEIVLFTLVTAIAHKAFPAFTTAVVFTLERKGSFMVTVTRFAAFRSKPKVVGLTALTVLTGDARLALTLPGADVTLPIGGTQSMAVTPLAALPALQVVVARVTSTAVAARHMRQTLALSGHRVTAALLLHCPVGIAGAGFAFVGWIGSQGISEKPFLAPVAVETSRVIDALQALARQAVAVANRVGVYVVVTLARAAQSHRPIAAQRVSKVAVITEFTSLAGSASRTVRAHHFLCLWDNGTT